MNGSNKKSNIVKVIVVLVLISLFAFVIFRKDVVSNVTVPVFNKPDEISYSDYYWVGDFVDSDPTLTPFAKHYIDNDGIIDETEYADIVNRYKLNNENTKLVESRKRLKEQLN